MGNGGLEAAFAKLLLLARRVREQQQRQRGPKVYSLHAPEVECIGKGKAHRPYEFASRSALPPASSTARAPVRHPCEDAARQSIRWPDPGYRDSGDGAALGNTINDSLAAKEIAATCVAGLQVQRVTHRAEARERLRLSLYYAVVLR